MRRVLLMIACSLVFTGEGPMNTVVNMTGTQLRASAAALAQFSKIDPKPELAHFSVQVLERPESFEIIFVPEHPRDQPTLRGGETKYGKEIHYTVSRDSFAVTNISYAR